MNWCITNNFNYWTLHTLPQARQWWRRRVNVNGVSHCIHISVSESGLHTGATFPSCVIGRLILAQSGGYDGGEVGIGKLAAALSIACSPMGWCPDDTSSEPRCAAMLHHTTPHHTAPRAVITTNSNWTEQSKLEINLTVLRQQTPPTRHLTSPKSDPGF